MIKNGIKKVNNLFIIYYLKNNLNQTKFYIANIGKKAVQKSSDRNLIKRRIRGILNKNKNLLKNLNILIISKHKISPKIKFNELEKYMVELLQNIGER